MNDYYQLYELTIDGFIKNGFEIYQKSSVFCSLRKWKLVHQLEDIKIIETQINIYFDNNQNPSEVIVRFSYYERK
jgi:hypothetical protein